MPTVTGKIANPDLTGRTASVSFELVDQNNQPVRAFKTSTDETIVGPQPAPLTDGTYEIVLPDNAGLNPADTYWARSIHLYGQTVTDRLLVPVGGGPYDEEDILAGPLTPLPTTVPSNEVDEASIAANITGLALNNALIPVALAGLTVTVPDLSRPVYLRASAVIQCGTANVVGNLLIAPVGSTLITQGIGGQPKRVTAAAIGEGVIAEGRLPANSPGEYGAFISAGSGTWDIVAAAYSPARIYVLAV